MQEFFVSHWNLPHNSSLGRVPATKEAVSQKTYPTSFNRSLQIYFSIEYCYQGPFACRMEKGQVEVFHNEGTNGLIQDKNREKPYHDNATHHMPINSIIAIIVLIHIIIIEEVKYPKADVDFVTQNLRPTAKRLTSGLYFSWGCGCPLIQRKLAMKSSRL